LRPDGIPADQFKSSRLDVRDPLSPHDSGSFLFPVAREENIATPKAKEKVFRFAHFHLENWRNFNKVDVDLQRGAV
jgi:hypothetical protein